MKRSGFKPRKTPLRKKSNKPISKAKAKAWSAFSLYIVTRDGIRTTGDWKRCLCVTCGREFATRGQGRIQAGHWLGGRKGLNLFATEGTHGQCYGCNCRGHGEQVKYTAWMTEHYGHAKMDAIVRAANTPYQWTVDELDEIERNFTQMTNALIERNDI